MSSQQTPTIPRHDPVISDTLDAGISHSLKRAIQHVGIAVYFQDAELRVVWSQNAPAAWQGGCVAGARDADFFSASEAEQLTQAKRRVLKTGQHETCEIAVQGSKGMHWFDIWIDVVAPSAVNGRDDAGGVLTTAVETTEQKHREHTLKSLLREVSHRSKNLLAIIQSIATQTGRYSGSIEIFLTRFRGRLQSLAASQDLVTLSNWRGADLRELIANQVGRYAANPRASIRVEGINPYLNPNAALHLGLALHELAVNSMSYGALSQPGGFVSISARQDVGEDGHKTLIVGWSEATRPGDDIEKRFGSVALERVVPASLKGTAALNIGDDRLDYTLTVPAAAAGYV